MGPYLKELILDFSSLIRMRQSELLQVVFLVNHGYG